MAFSKANIHSWQFADETNKTMRFLIKIGKKKRVISLILMIYNFKLTDLRFMANLKKSECSCI